MEKLTKRQIEALNIVVKNYIEKGEARGSHSLKAQFNVNFSAATLRNIMSDLEKKGYLTHLHTSSGKIPTPKGYRFYVENLLSLDDDKQVVFLGRRRSHIDGIAETLENVVYEVSNISRCISITSLNPTPFLKLKKISFIKVDENEILSIIASNIGIVESNIVCTEESFSQEQLEEFSEYLSEKATFCIREE